MPENQASPESQAIEKRADVALTKNGLMPKTMEEAWRYANALAKTVFVPATYQGKPEDCLIAIDMAQRLGVAPLMFLQNTYIVHGRPGMEAKLVIALVNNSGFFADPLEYEIDGGEDPDKKTYRVRAFATRAKTGKVLYGPWITWAVVDKEGWAKKPGSKWLTMPGLMFAYRAASWFCNMHCPEVKMGMATTQELDDMDLPKHVESTTLEPTEGRKSFGFQGEQPPATETPAGEAGEQEQAPAEEQKLSKCFYCKQPTDKRLRHNGHLSCPGCIAKDADTETAPSTGTEQEDAKEDAGVTEATDGPPAPTEERDGDAAMVTCHSQKCQGAMTFMHSVLVKTEYGLACPHCGLIAWRPAVMAEAATPKAEGFGDAPDVLTCPNGHEVPRSDIIATPLASKPGQIGKCPTCDAAGVPTIVTQG